MKSKILGCILVAISAGCCAFAMTACNNDNSANQNSPKVISTVQSAYETALDMGYDGTLDDFIIAIKGNDGIDGANGKDGQDGTGVESAEFNADGELIFTLTDGSTINAGKLPECEHSWGEHEVIIEGSCGSIGCEKTTCLLCGHTEYLFTPCLEHQWDEGVELSNMTVYTCQNCNDTRITVNHDLPNQPLPPVTNEFILPVTDAVITVRYEFRYDPTLEIYGRHQGLDFSAEAGTEVYSALDGVIVEIFNDGVDDYITIEHNDGIQTKYVFIDALGDLKVGDQISQGEIIGYIQTANGSEEKDGNHLHFEIIVNGIAVDPSEYLSL